ncbi:C25 family cysteine peptidase [Pontibacter sp. 13R65]|uniref:putative type IX secretion system sortase PorU2 n=1 Tax=Pontibacter sp. 13R65 TaxID=3127458 RepID=UPI00301BFD82
MSFNLFTKGFLLTLVLVCCFTAFNAKGQGVYGNEWINYSQPYYKIKVVNTGLHRLNFALLDSMGLSSVDPRHFQLFRRGKEVSIYVAGEETGQLGPQSYIEFFGERNDGAMDRELYKNPAHQVSQYHSLYTDTSTYFLTYSPQGGKRMRVINPAVDGRSPEPYHLQKVVFTAPERYYYGKFYADNKMSWMDEGEGYFSHSSRNIKNYTITGITNVESSGPKPILDYGVGTVNNILHLFVIKAGTATNSLRQVSPELQVNGYSALVGKSQLEFNDINLAQSRFIFQTDPGGRDANQVSLSFCRLTFPQKTIFSGNSLMIYTDSTRSAFPYYEYASMPTSVVAYDVTDTGNAVRIEGHVQGSNRKGFVIPDNQTSRKILLANTANPFKPAGKIQRINFRAIDPDAHNYLIITNKRLMKPVNGSSIPAPVEYAAFRASQAGGGYDTLLLHMDQIVDQFHYGEYSANSVRRMMKFMLTSSRQKHLFIIGKGLKYAGDEYNWTIYPGKFSYYQVGARHPKVYEMDLVPTGLAPVSDVFFTADFHNSSYVPQVPTGRLAVTKPESIIHYLNKVKEYEALPEALPWRKNILQLGGGKQTNEITQISSYLRNYAQIAKGPFLGANVLEKYRQNVSEVVESVNVSEEVNAGLSLITFFGHSAPGTTDLDIGFVSSAVMGYRNKGRYPIMIMNGCNAGDAFIPGNISFGEDWLHTPDKGAVAFMAHAEAGYANFLNLYSSNIYATAFQDPNFYGNSIGQIQQEAIRRVTRNTSSDIAVAMVTQIVLQGDPAIKPYSPAKPDYLFVDGEVSLAATDGGLLTAATENFIIDLGVNNLGKAVPNSIKVSVKRTLSDNTVLTIDSIKVKPILNKDRVQLNIENTGVASMGMNTFEVTLDPENEIEELNKENNIIRFQHFFPINGLLVLSPVDYSVVNTNRVKLTIQATGQDSKGKGYYFEIDTTQAFNSSLKQTFTAQNTILPSWEVSLPTINSGKDSTVYYWRARFQQYEAGEDTLWAASSFRYIANGTPGWSQSHYGQFTKAVTVDIENKGAESLAWEFNPTQSVVEIRTVGGDIRFSLPTYGMYVNLHEMEARCGSPHASAVPRLYFMVFNDITLEAMTDIPGQTGCSADPHVFEFGDLRTAANIAKVEAFLKAIPANQHVAVMSVNNVPFSNFSATLRAAFRGIGSSLIDNLQTGYPFAMVGRKGAAPGTAQEVSASAEDETPATSQAAVLRVTLESKRPAGTITSSIIGPAQKWGSVFSDIKRLSSGDQFKLRVHGITSTGEQQELEASSSERTIDLTSINATEYPYLQLSAFLADTAARTAPQLKQWMVQYEGAPEGVIRPDLVKVSEEILTQQALNGSITVPMAFQNVSDVAFKDSLTVEITVTGDGMQPTKSQLKIAPLAANQIAHFNYTMSTLALSGAYKVSIYVNPRILLEQQYYNNIFEVPFNVKPRLQPIVNVAFDGIHILDGELVSPSPLISITVKDENRHSFLQDPASMSLVLVNEAGVETDVELMGNPQEVRYYPADEKNDFRLEYKPTLLNNGIYTMEVRARDVAGIPSGISPYRISFEVVKESTVTNFYPFPNPFSTKTNFIFTLTGMTIPQDLKIQIMTVTGKVVKEIMKEELGPIRIGNNKSEYAWDGTDTFGDKLANGVYLYRVVMGQTEEEMKHRATAGDKAFKNGYGKLYILR